MGTPSPVRTPDGFKKGESFDAVTFASSGPIDADPGDNIVVDTTAGNVNVNLPPAAKGEPVCIANQVGGNLVIVAADGTDGIVQQGGNSGGQSIATFDSVCFTPVRDSATGNFFWLTAITTLSV